MIASELIHNETPLLNTTDRVTSAINLFNRLSLLHLPVFNGNRLIGVIGEEDVLNAHTELKIQDLNDQINKQKILDDAHIYSTLTHFVKNKLSLLPVVDNNDNYLGCIHSRDIFHKICEWLNINESQGVIHIEIEHENYSLAQIAQIVEANKAKILTCISVPKNTNPNTLEIILKINQNELTSIIQTLERYKYKIIATFHKNIHQKDLDDRFNSFIRYLNI